MLENGRTEYRDERNRKTVDKYDVYEFTAANGQRVRFSSLNTSLRPSKPVCSRTDILYDPSDPSAVRLADDSMHRTATVLVWLSPIGLAIAGAIGLIWARTRS